MRRIILKNTRQIPPFNEAARDLRIQNKPLWLHQRDLLTSYTISGEMEYEDREQARKFEKENDGEEVLVHRDNLYFNEHFITELLTRAREMNKPVRVAFREDDPAIREHVRPLTTLLEKHDNLLLAEMWYLPKGYHQIDDAEPIVIDTEARERGYYHIPPYTASIMGDLVYQLPRKAFVVIESWVHVFIADILFGIFSYGADVEDEINLNWKKKVSILWASMMEQKPFLSSSELVQIGQNTNIHPTAQITGPAIIGNNVSIDAGVVIDACIIGDNVTVSQGCQLHISVVGDGCFLPFRAALFMTTMMENTMVAQNTCLQLCVVGRDTFIGAGSTFTDTSVMMAPIKAINGHGELEPVPLQVIGGCVGHHCHLGSGLVIYPARTIESDVIIIPNDDKQFITHSVTFADSDHHPYVNSGKYKHPRLYPSTEEMEKARL